MGLPAAGSLVLGASLAVFRHVSPLPSAALAVGPLVVLAAVAVGLGGLGLAAFDRRDLG